MLVLCFRYFLFLFLLTEREGKKVEGKLVVWSGQTAHRGGASQQVSVGGKVQNREGESNWATTHRDKRWKGRGSRLGGKVRWVQRRKEQKRQGERSAKKKKMGAERERVSRVSPRQKWGPRRPEQPGRERKTITVRRTPYCSRKYK